MAMLVTTPYSSAPSTESALSINRTNLLNALGLYLPWNADPTLWSPEQSAIADQIIKSGERMFYQPERLPGEHSVHTWSFLNQDLNLPVVAPYSTGTVVITAGAVTLTGGTWPTWAAAGWLTVGGSDYEVSARTSNTVITLEDTTASAAAGSSFKLEQWQYALPNDYGHFLENSLKFRPDSQTWYRVKLTGAGEIFAKRQVDWATSLSLEQSLLAAHNPRQRDADTGPRFDLLLWPTPTRAGIITGPYYANPYAIGPTDPYPMGGQPHAETLLEAVLAAAELRMNDERTVHRETLKERLWASVALDRRTNTPKFFGYNGDRSSGSYDDHRHVGQYVTYNHQL
jgi:hypothetical protein